MSLVPSLVRDFALPQPARCWTATGSCGFDQESHPTLAVNFILGPLTELERFCKIQTHKYFCKETEISLRLLPW